MKKVVTFILMLCMALSLSACGNEEITMQEIYDASNLTTLLEKHESVYVRYSESGKLYEEKYLSKEYSYTFMDGEVYGLASDFLSFTSDHAFYSYYDGEYIRSLLISSDGLSDVNYDMSKNANFALEEGTLQETIQSVKKKDGRIIVTSFESPEAIKDSEMEGLVSYNAEYVLDAKTHELISVKDVIEYDDGTVYNVVVDFIYDGEIPEEMKAFVEYEQQTEDFRTITIVSNPGTESEKSESVQIPKGLSIVLEPDFIFEIDFSMNPDIEGAFELYSDAACTQPFDLSEDNDSDVTIYVKWCQ